ncbi:beta strand repeat-containing protein [Nitrospira moscoviensis]|nr:filamentous hemagglutinin N-terminal domain-containing protein [Nitrospira moscoviensis]
MSILRTGPTLAVLLFVFAGQLNPSHAQIVRDGTIGPPGGPLTGPNYRIDSTLGTLKGSNLFHSFSEFNVRTLPSGVIESATFTNSLPITITNVLSRVTGGVPSEINGLLASEIPGANLFFMNPSGIVFGWNASLNVAGSVHFTTADYIRLFDGTNNAMFYANAANDAITTPTRTSILSSAPLVDFGFVTPAAVGFLTPSPASITVQGSVLSVPNGQSLTMIGGNIDIRSALLEDGSIQTASMSAPGGQVKLGSIATPGEMVPSSLQPANNIDGAFPTLGNITIAEGSFIDVSDTQGGTISIRGGQFVLDGSFLVASTAGDDPGASTAVKIHTDGDVTLSNSSFILSEAQGAGQPGDIEIMAKNVWLTEGSIVEARSLGSASAGNISVNAEDGSVSLSGTNSFFGTGAAIRIDAGPCTDCGGSSGNLSVKAKNVSLDDLAHLETLTFGKKKAGSIWLDVDNLTVRGGSAVQTIGSDASSGEISIIARGLVSLSGQFDSDNRSQISNENNNPGGTGSIFVQAKQLEMGLNARMLNKSTAEPVTSDTSKIDIKTVEDIRLSSGSEIIVQSELSVSSIGGITMSGRDISLTGNSVVQTATSGSGDAGSLDITASNVTLSGMSQFRSGTSFGSGKGGNLGIKANTVSVTEGSTITASSLGPGKAGNVTIEGTASPAESVMISGGESGIFTTTSGTGVGGDILLIADSVRVKDGGTLSAKTAGTATAATGGTITVQGEDIRIESGATITAASTGPGKAGNILIEGTASPAQLLKIQDPSSGLFTETSGTGAGGNITTWSNQLQVTNGATISSKTTGQMPNAGDAGDILIKADGITISGGATITAASTGTGKAGTLTIQGTQSPAQSLLVTGSGSGLFSNTSGTGTGGNILVVADDVELTNGGTLSAKTTGTASTATGGTITVQGDDIRIESGATITAASTGPGKAGNILIEGTASPAQSILITGPGSSVLTETSGTGTGGDITTWSEQLQLTNSATISSRTTGQMPNAGDAGDILIKADDITISGGATITAASTGTGNAGTVTIQGTNSPGRSLLITGPGSGLFSNTSGTGAGGDILAMSDSVLLTNGGTLSAATSGTSASAVGGTIGIEAAEVRIENGALVTAASTGRGKGGNIGVTASRTFESNGGTISTAASLADAGSIAISAGQSARLDNGATISTRSTGPGNAGGIFINGGRRFEMRNSAVTAQAAQAAGGFIDIRAVERVKLENSLISTSVLGGSGSGGNIFIDPQLISLENSAILAQAVFGNGGNITLVTPLLLLDSTSLINASSQFGQSGQIQAPTSNLAGTVSSLPSSIRQAPSLQTGRCAALANSQSSSFLIAGRDAIPNEPGGWQPRPFAVSGDGSGLAARDDGHENLKAAPLMAMAEGTVSLRRLTPAGFLTHSFAESGSTGCRA